MVGVCVCVGESLYLLSGLSASTVLRSAKATKNTRAHGNADNWNTILVKALEYGHNRLITTSTEVMKLRETAKADPSALSTVSGISPHAGTVALYEYTVGGRRRELMSHDGATYCTVLYGTSVPYE